MLLISCKNSTKNITSTKTTIKDTVSTTELPEIKLDTIIKVSKPFKINGIECNWKHYITNDGVRFIFKNYRTNQILIDTDFILTYISENETSPSYFDTVNKELFVDLNFDGYKDFICESSGSNGAMSNSTLIYIFNPKTKSFYYSEELQANDILKIDKIKRLLILRHEWRDGQDSTIIYFNKLGKIKSTEVYSGYTIKRETEAWGFQEYIKTINGKIVEYKRDSTVIE